MDDRAIAFFDSGIGGLSCVETFKERLPRENLIYYGDTLHAPYGDRAPEEIAAFADGISAFLTAQNIKMLVVACNTVSSLHLDRLRQRYPSLPVMGTIELTAKHLAENCAGKSIGIIATRATVASGTYLAQLEKHGCRGRVYALACPEFVPMIEAGVHEGPEAETAVRRSMEDFIREKNIEVLVLGCTHFPFIRGTIEKLFPQLLLVDPADMMAAGAEVILKAGDALASMDCIPTERYYASRVTEVCRSAVKRVGGGEPVELVL